MDMERKQFDFTQVEMKAGPKGQGRLVGYAATFGNLDRQNDIIMPGSFKDSLDTFLRDGFIALGHDHDALPVATPDVAKEDEHGLWLEVDFHSTPTAQQARTVAQERLERGKSVSLSIGFTIPEGGYEYSESGVRLIKAIRLFETSLVNIPANPMALVAGVKGHDLPDGLTFADHSDAVLDAVKGLAERATEIHQMRRKAGRVLSAANVARLRAIMDALHELMSMAERAQAEADAAEAVAAEQAGGKGKRAIAPSYLRYAARLQQMEEWASTKTAIKTKSK